MKHALLSAVRESIREYWASVAYANLVRFKVKYETPIGSLDFDVGEPLKE